MAKQIPTQPKGAEGVSAVRDAAERAQALDPERSFIVQAPAGSGKTALLVQRLLVLLARVEEPEEVVAITFTRKAAGEMRARLLETLARARSAEPPPEPHEQQVWTLARAVLARDQERDWGLPQHPARLRVYTYDAFCQALARQAPVRSGLGGGLEVGEDPMPLYEKAVRITLAELEKSGAEGDAVAVLLTHLDNNLGQLARLLQSMLATRDQWLRHVSAGWKPEALRTELETGLHRTLQEELRRLRQDLGAALSLADPDGAFPALVRHAAVHGSTPEQPHPLAGFQELPGTDPAQIALWKAVAALMLTQDGFWRKRLDKRGGFPTDKEAGDPKALKAAKQTMESLLGRMAQALDPGVLARVWRLPPSGYTDAQWGVLSALLTLLPRAASHLRQVFAATGQVDFIEPVQAALNVLEPAGGVRHPWPGQPPRHLLVDEFQDTSITQHRLLERMVETWQEGDGRTVFLVGDPMQSIYGWREAEVGLFLRARLQGLGRVALTPLTVRVNFRSRQGIVDWVNQAFPAVLAPREDVGTGAVVYSPAEAVHSPGPEAEPVRIHPLLLREDQSTEACIEEEANRVAAIALESQQEIPGGSVAVLVRARSHLSAIVPALRRAGLAFQAVNIDPLVTRPVVSDLLSLTRVLIHPADRVAWLSLLRSPCCGLLLADLLALSQGDPPPPVWSALRNPECVAQLTADGRARVGRMLPVLETALARLGPLRRRVEGAWLAMGGPAVLEGAEIGQAQSFLELLEQRFPGGVMPTQRELESALEGLYAGVEPASGELLQLMTVHQAKGLEFDTVILPGLERKPGKDEAGLLTWFERPMEGEPPRLLLAPVGATGEDEDPVYGFLKEVRRERRYQEAGRLLYV
ncbi:MAG: UvrD-helicase domain-containing protein, partial [Deltaproteobacteria bacterium]|nr:UvrD-helicase domain-containing protein [Deltaproteobacteria bacterium]